MTKATEPLWFESVSPHLLRNKAIRGYLGQYNGKDWPEIVKLTLLYGILNLQKRYPGQILPIERLRAVLRASQSAVTVESALPDLQGQLEFLQSQLAEVTDDIENNKDLVSTKAVPPAAAPNPPVIIAQRPPAQERLEEEIKEIGEAQHTLHSIHLRKPAGLPLEPQDVPERIMAKAARANAVLRSFSPGGIRPPTDWRDGQQPLTYAPPGKKRSPGRNNLVPGSDEGIPTGAYYPAWWGDGSDQQPAQPKRPQEPKQARPPPRMAYSQQPDGPKPIYENDLVTSRYLGVPSSGYGQDAPPPQVPPGYYPPGYGPYGPTGEAFPQYDLPPQQQQLQPPAQQQHQQQQQQYPPPMPQMQPQGAVPAGQMFMLAPSGALVPVMMPDAMQQQQQGGKEEGKGKKVKLSQVQSRIRNQVEADRNLAKLKLEARRRAAIAAIGPSTAPSTAGSSKPGQSLTTTSRSPPPSQIADSLESNPYTSWFMGTQGPPGAPQAPQAGQQRQQQQPGAGQHPFAAPQSPLSLTLSPPRGASLTPDSSLAGGPVMGQPGVGGRPPAARFSYDGVSYPYTYSYPDSSVGGGGGAASVPSSAPPAPYPGMMLGQQQPQQISPVTGYPYPAIPGAGGQAQQHPQQAGGRVVAWGDEQPYGGAAAAAAAGGYPGMQLQGPGPSPGLSMQGPASGDGPRRRYAGVRDEVFSWSKKWVGDYGHLSEPRFPPAPEVNEGGRGKGDNGAELRASSAPSQRPGAAHTGMSPSGSEVASSSGGIGALGGAIPGAATASAAAYKANAGAFMAWQSDLAPGNSAEVAKAAAIAQALAGGGADGLSPIKGRTITTEISTPLHSEDLSYLLAMDARTRRELLGDTTPGQDIATSSITGLSGAAYGGAGAGAGAGAGGGARSRPDTSARSTGSVSGSVSSIPIDELMRRMELEAEAEATSAAASGSKANNAARPGSAAAAGWGAPGSGSGAGGGGGGGGGGSKLSGEEERVWLRVLNQMADVSPGEGPAMEVLTSASIRRRWDLDEAMGQPPSAPYQ